MDLLCGKKFIQRILLSDEKQSKQNPWTFSTADWNNSFGTIFKSDDLQYPFGYSQ